MEDSFVCPGHCTNLEACAWWCTLMFVRLPYMLILPVSWCLSHELWHLTIFWELCTRAWLWPQRTLKNVLGFSTLFLFPIYSTLILIDRASNLSKAARWTESQSLNWSYSKISMAPSDQVSLIQLPFLTIDVNSPHESCAFVSECYFSVWVPMTEPNYLLYDCIIFAARKASWTRFRASKYIFLSCNNWRLRCQIL